MDLEFELKIKDIEDNLIIYEVKRKGLTVGTLALDKEPYSYDMALKKRMFMTDKRGDLYVK